MVEKLDWKGKYSLSLIENMSIKDIERLTDCGQPQAISIRNDSIRYCEKNNIYRFGTKVPTEVVLLIIGKSREYYYQRMLDEKKLEQDLKDDSD
ncbi:MAG: hypothetical protein IJI66_02040 [Erysipelotrichaceae bacterium]|nr:hypothetical protein [Erysipelotrichaceae bacterium]